MVKENKESSLGYAKWYGQRQTVGKQLLREHNPELVMAAGTKAVQTEKSEREQRAEG